MNQRHLSHLLRLAQDSINHAVDEYGAWHRHIVTTMPDGYPSGGDVDHVSGGGIGDPTGSSMLARRQGARLLHDAQRTITDIQNLTAHLDSLLKSGPQRVDISTIKRAARCSGTVDPTCTNVADGRRHKTGLCDRCWMVQYRAEKRAS
jgi:hypothetical protein